MSRARGLLALVALAAGAACVKPVSKKAEAPRSRGASVVLVSIDTLRSDHLPAYGGRGAATPALDALASDGVVFERAYSPCPLTLPAHASILTGLDPPGHGVRDNIGFTLDASRHPTLASLFKARGYRTGAAVSAFVLRGATGLSASFDLYDDRVEAPAGASAAGAVQRAGPETMKRALAWLDDPDPRPFFLFVHLYEPHAPYDPPEPFRSASASAYDGEIAFADSILGTLVADLARRGLYDGTLLVVLSDHGEGLGEHGESEHGILLYREALQVPLVVKLPGSRGRGTRVTSTAALVDVLPTLAGELGLAAPAGLAGVDLLADGVRPDPERRVFSETAYPRLHLGWSELRSLVGGRHHFIEGVRPELYDLAQDPGEAQDVSITSGDVARDFKRDLNRIAAPAAVPENADSEARKKLASLGYLSGESPSVHGPLPDPRASLPILEDMRKAFVRAAEGHDAEALAGLRAVLARQPGLFDARYGEAEILARMGRYDEAAAAYVEARRASPSLAGPVALALARVTLELGRLHEAEENAREARRESPAEAAVVLAEVALRRDRPADALAALDAAGNASAAPPRNFEFLRGDALARTERFSEAEAAFRAEIRLHPANAQAWSRLAIVLALRHRTRGEVDDLLAAMVRANPAPATVRLAAKTLESIGDHDGAARWVRRGREH